MIITLTGLAALARHLLAGATPDVTVTVLLAGWSAAGALVGTLLAERVPQRLLGRGFAVVVATVAAFLLVDTLLFGGPPGS